MLLKPQVRFQDRWPWKCVVVFDGADSADGGVLTECMTCAIPRLIGN